MAPQPSARTVEATQAAYLQHQQAMLPYQTQASPEFNRLELRLIDCAIEKYCDHMHLDEAVPSQAIGILRQYVEETRYWTDRHAMIAACIFIACRQCDISMEYISVRAAVGTSTVLGLAVLLTIENQYYRRSADITMYKFRAKSAEEDCYMVTPPSGPSAMILRAYSTSDPKLVDLFCRSQDTALELQPEIIGYKIRTICRYKSLGEDVAVLAANIFKESSGDYPDSAVIAASIVLACRECDKFMKHAKILRLMGRGLLGMDLLILLEVEKTHYREAGAEDVGRPKVRVVPRNMHTLPIRVWAISPPWREEVLIRADYSSRDPKIMDLYCQSPKLDSPTSHHDPCNITIAPDTKGSIPSEEGDVASSTEWELVEHVNDELPDKNGSRDTGAKVFTLADSPGGSSGEWTMS